MAYDLHLTSTEHELSEEDAFDGYALDQCCKNQLEKNQDGDLRTILKEGFAADKTVIIARAYFAGFDVHFRNIPLNMMIQDGHVTTSPVISTEIYNQIMTSTRGRPGIVFLPVDKVDPQSIEELKFDKRSGLFCSA